MENQRYFGLHLRLKKNLFSLLEEAETFNIKIFQFFLTKQHDGKYFKILPEELCAFKQVNQEKCKELYIHSSYWINLASGKPVTAFSSVKLLKKEIRLAKQLGIKNIVLHAGSATGHAKTENNSSWKMAGIKMVAKNLNKALANENEVKILLENTAHGNKTIGSDIQDLAEIKKLLNEPEKVNFCLDLAHAFAYGYDIKEKAQFLSFVDKTIGIKNIKLIHLHDSGGLCGSKLDNHKIPGQGFIGIKILKNIINDPKLSKIPIILETPPSSKREIVSLLKEVNSN